MIRSALVGSIVGAAITYAVIEYWPREFDSTDIWKGVTSPIHFKDKHGRKCTAIASDNALALDCDTGFGSS